MYFKDMTPPEWVRERYLEARRECLRLSKDKSRNNEWARALAQEKALDLKHYLQRLESQWKTN